MAIVHPTGWRELQVLGAAQRELETLGYLAGSLPDAYTVYHGVHWTRLQHGFSVFGEIDFVIVAPSGRVLIIEQKSGFLEETADGLYKNYGQQKKNVAVQIERSIEGIQARYTQGHAGERLRMDYLLYCPDFTVAQPHIAGIEPQRIVDATRREHLARVIESAIPATNPDPKQAAAVGQFFQGVLELVPEIGAVSAEARALYSRLSGGLATWARRLDFTPFRLRVIGTAGSGKTQLALAVLREAVAAGRRPLYVCFNRPLADHLVQVAPTSAEVLTYHQLCDRALRSQGYVPDFSNTQVFREIEARFAECAPGPEWRFDELIVDEGQDFEQAWVKPLLSLLRPGARAWWLEDPMQNLYGRPAVSLPEWVTLRSDTNYRSPRGILERINRLIGLDRPITPGSPLAGSECEIFTYRDMPGLVQETKRAITQCIGEGFKRSMIAVVTFRGRENSALSPFDELGQYRLRKFTGHYDLLGSPIYSDGDVTLETVFRFKGQSAPAVVFTEIDFETLDESAARRIFVGATRATMKLMLVVSERAAEIFLRRLSDSSTN